MDFSLSAVLQTFIQILTVVPNTMLLAAIILIFGILFGLILFLIERLEITPLNVIINILKTYVRGVPLIVHLFILQALLPDFAETIFGLLGIAENPNNVPSVLIVLITYITVETATESENIKSAFSSVDYNQVEAGKSIGFTQSQNLRHIIIPQALSVALPLFLNAYLKNIKALSLAFAVGVVDILTEARFIAAETFRYLEAYVAAALVYWLICGILQYFFDKFEKRMRVLH